MPRRRIVAALAALIMVAAACGGASTETAADSEPATTPPGGAETTRSEEGVEAGPSAPGASELSFSVADDWTAVSLGQGVKPVIALDPSGTPGVAWLLERIGDGFIAFASAGTGWETEVVFEGYFYGPIDLDFAPDGQPNIAIHDHQADSFNPQLGDLVRLFPADDGWEVDIAEDPGHDGWDSTIVVDDEGVIHAAGVDPAQFGRIEGIEYYRNEGNGWEVTQIGSGPIQYQYNVSLALDGSNRPAITYYDDTDGDLVYAGLGGKGWELERVAEEGDVGKYSSLAFTPKGPPAVSFFRQDAPSSGEIVYAFKEGDAWVLETVGSIESFSEPNARRNSSLAFDGDGRAHVAFSDTSGVWYSIRGDDGWETTQIVSADLPLGQLVSLVIDDEGRPHLALYEVSGQGGDLDGLVAYLTTG